MVDGIPASTSIPVTVAQEGPSLMLRGHLSRANPQAGSLEGARVLVVFSGPHAYISPRHYDAERSVPTWDYVAVQASGTAHALPAADVPAQETLLAELIAEHEPSLQTRRDRFPETFRHAMLRGIVGFEVPIDRLDGRAKLSGNKSAVERGRIAAALAASDDPSARDTGRWMTRREAALPDGGEEPRAPERYGPDCPFAPASDE